MPLQVEATEQRPLACRSSLIDPHVFREVDQQAQCRVGGAIIMAHARKMERHEDDTHPEAAVAPGYLANHAARLFNRAVDNALRPHGLTLALIGPILLLSWKGPMLQRDLVRSSAIKQPAMVALLDKLEAQALIVRTPSITDRRASMVALTDQGREAARLGGAVLIDTNRRGVDGFSPEEADNLVHLLQRLVANFEQE